MPTSLLGVAFYVFALFPGIAFIFAREGHQPVAKRSVVRETATLVFISAICDAAVALVVAGVALCWTGLGDRVQEIISGDLTWAQRHPFFSLVALIVAAGSATLLGLLLGTRFAHNHGLDRLSKAVIPRNTSGWKKLFDAKPGGQDVVVVVAVVLKSGGWVSGTLHDFDNDPDPHPHRVLILAEPQYRAPGDDEPTPLVDTEHLLIEAGEIEVLQVMYKLPGNIEPPLEALGDGHVLAKRLKQGVRVLLRNHK